MKLLMFFNVLQYYVFNVVCVILIRGGVILLSEMDVVMLECVQ